jgi:hypothetical protein
MKEKKTWKDVLLSVLVSVTLFLNVNLGVGRLVKGYIFLQNK